MIVRVPDYFSEFSCIAGDCKDSCCLGWEIDIDEDSYEYYQTLPGEVGERLRKVCMRRRMAGTASVQTIAGAALC